MLFSVSLFYKTTHSPPQDIVNSVPSKIIDGYANNSFEELLDNQPAINRNIADVIRRDPQELVKDSYTPDDDQISEGFASRQPPPQPTTPDLDQNIENSATTPPNRVERSLRFKRGSQFHILLGTQDYPQTGPQLFVEIDRQAMEKTKAAGAIAGLHRVSESSELRLIFGAESLEHRFSQLTIEERGMLRELLQDEESLLIERSAPASSSTTSPLNPGLFDRQPLPLDPQLAQPETQPEVTNITPILDEVTAKVRSDDLIRLSEIRRALNALDNLKTRPLTDTGASTNVWQKLSAILRNMGATFGWIAGFGIFIIACLSYRRHSRGPDTASETTTPPGTEPASEVALPTATQTDMVASTPAKAL